MVPPVRNKKHYQNVVSTAGLRGHLSHSKVRRVSGIIRVVGTH